MIFLSTNNKATCVIWDLNAAGTLCNSTGFCLCIFFISGIKWRDLLQMPVFYFEYKSLKRMKYALKTWSSKFNYSDYFGKTMLVLKFMRFTVTVSVVHALIFWSGWGGKFVSIKAIPSPAYFNNEPIILHQDEWGWERNAKKISQFSGKHKENCCIVEKFKQFPVYSNELQSIKFSFQFLLVSKSFSINANFPRITQQFSSYYFVNTQLKMKIYSILTKKWIEKHFSGNFPFPLLLFHATFLYHLRL